MNAFSKFRMGLAKAILPSAARRYEAAGSGRRFGKGKSFGSFRAETSAARPQLVAKSRHLFANTPYAANACHVWESNLVGSGVTCAPKHADADTRKLLTDTFTTFADNADADGRTNWAGIQTLVVLGMIRDGESFVHVLQTESGPKLRLIPPERVQALTTNPNITDGIEFDDAGNRVAYHVLKSDLSTETVRVDARDILHIFLPLAAGQLRGIPWLAPVMLTLSDYDELQDALLMAAKISAMFAGFLTNNNDTGTIPFDGTQSGENLEVSLEPGTVKMLPAGYSMQFSSPQNLPVSIEFGKLTLQSIAAGMGLPDWMLTGNVSQVNYSTARAAMIQLRTRVEAIQFNTLLPLLIRPIYERVITSAILSGKLDVELSDALAFDMYPSKMAHLDPSKEAEGEKIAVESGFKSRRQVVAELGYSVEDIDLQIFADREREKLLGLSFISTQNNNGGQQNANPTQG
jgi:lambda family phage portal protein